MYHGSLTAHLLPYPLHQKVTAAGKDRLSICSLNKQGTDGLRAKCKDCMLAREVVTEKCCTGCKTTKLAERFSKDCKGGGGLKAKCKDCESARMKEATRKKRKT